MKPAYSAAIVGVLVLAMIASASLYTVDQRQRAILFQLGEVKDVIETPGLHFKLPLIQNVRFFDTRILTLDTRDAERVTTEGNVPVLVVLPMVMVAFAAVVGWPRLLVVVPPLTLLMWGLVSFFAVITSTGIVTVAMSQKGSSLSQTWYWAV